MRIRIYPDWPTLLGIAAPAATGAVLGLLARLDTSAILGVFVGAFLLAFPLGIGISYFLSCRVMDRMGQPWAYMSFFVSLASWIWGVWLFMDLSGIWNNK